MSLCCDLIASSSSSDDESSAVQAEFYPFQPGRNAKRGTFSLLVPNPATVPPPAFPITRDGGDDDFNAWSDAQQAKLVRRVLKHDVQVGDEIAIQPGRARLEYRGPHFPITEIVYIAFGTGIATVLDQVRAVMPDSSGSSVELVSVVWINAAARDFDVTTELLEKEYNKYSQKLSVSCVVDDLGERSSLAENEEISEVVPSFKPGTMAVLSGPSVSIKKAVTFLQDEKGFPIECICVL